MSTSVAEKVLALAFHPSTGEHEAVAAFLKARRMVPANPDFTGFLREGQNASATKNNSSYSSTSSNKSNYERTIRISVRSIPTILESLNAFSKYRNRSPIFYSINVVSDSWTAIGWIDLKISCYIPENDLSFFRDYIRKQIDRLESEW
jgi:hypothetical protein